MELEERAGDAAAVDAGRVDGQVYDAIVVGGGPAGLSGATVLGRFRRSVVVVDAGRLRNAAAAHSQGFFTRDGTSPGDLAAAGRAEAVSYGAKILDDTVTEVERVASGFLAHTASGRAVRGRRLLVTTGLVDDLKGLPGLAERWGRDVLHCPFCHGWEVRDRPTVVVAGTAMDTHTALLLTQLTKDLTLLIGSSDMAWISGEEQEMLCAAGVDIVQDLVREIVIEDDRVVGIRTGSGDLVAAEIVYSSPPMLAQDELLTGLGADIVTSDLGPVVDVDECGLTSLPHVWAAGNAVDPGAQVVHAASAGYRAATQIVDSLVMEDLAATVREASQRG